MAGLYPRRLGSTERSQRWRALGDTVSDLTGQRIQCKPSRIESDVPVTTKPTDRRVNCFFFFLFPSGLDETGCPASYQQKKEKKLWQFSEKMKKNDRVTKKIKEKSGNVQFSTQNQVKSKNKS